MKIKRIGKISTIKEKEVEIKSVLKVKAQLKINNSI